MAVIENHNGDSLANVYSNSRNTWYGISGYPTVFFDGVLNVVGGSGSSSMYGSYVPKVDQRLAIPSDFTIDVSLEQTDGDYSSVVTIENVGGNTETELVLHFVITESKMPIVWGLTEEQDFVNRMMLPDQNGTPLDFTGSSTQVVNFDFNTSYWDVDNCELVVFVQNTTTKEIKQGTKKFMAISLHDIDAEAKAVIHPVGIFCGSAVTPTVMIKNMGSENLISLDIEYSINGGTSQTFAWTGDIGFNLGENVELPEITFVSQAVNTFEFTVSNPNGEVDPNPGNDYFEQTFEAAPAVATSTVLFELMTDQYPEETSWELTNSDGTVLYSGGPYTGQTNTLFNETFEIAEADCYTFTIFDAYGDGICCAYGNGYYKLSDGDNVLFAEGGEFGSAESKPFEKSDGGTTTDCENFDALTVGGYVADQLGGMWTTWSGTPGTAEDAMVSDMYSYSPDNGFVVDAGTIDLIYQLAAEPITTGQHLFSNMIYVPAATSGYFNVQSEPTPGVEWVVEVFFNDDGTGNVTQNTIVTEFTYTQDTWIMVEINFDLESGFAQVYFDDVLFYEWENPIASIGGIDYFGWDTGGPPGAFYDDVCFTEGMVIVPSDPNCENFDALTVGGYVADQLGGMWTTWSGTPGTAEDAMVSDMYSYSPDNGFVVDAGTIDLILKLADEPITSGQWLYSNMIYVPAGTSGYFNIQSEPTPGVEWVVEVFFNDDGTGNVTQNTIVTEFTYTQDTWILVEINIDLDNGGAEVLFDGAEFYQWENPIATIGGIDYFGWDTGGPPGAYYDDVCFSDEGWLVIGVEEQVASATNLYPNPATDIVNIKSEYNMESVTVYNFAGQVVRTEAINSTTYRVNTSNLDAGIYLFQIETEEGRIAKRIIIE